MNNNEKREEYENSLQGLGWKVSSGSNIIYPLLLLSF